MSDLHLTPPRVQIVDAKGMITKEWFRFFLTLFNRVGGSVAPSNTDLTESLPEDAGVEETKAWLYRLADELSVVPAPAQYIPPDDVSPLYVAPQMDQDIETRVNALAAELDAIRTQMNDLKQGVTL